MSAIRNVLICCNSSKQEIVIAAGKMAEKLKDIGFCPMLNVYEHAPRLCDELNIRVLSDIGEVLKADFMLVIGGDGTMLHFANDAAVAKLPMLGINMGKLGFMTELEPAELPLMRNILEGKYSVDRRMMLDASVVRNGKVVFRDSALNDAVITKGDILRVIEVSVASDGAHLLSYSGDGIIVCTPTGSTAYSMSSGGPIVEPTSENLIITPICPHALYARALVLSPERTVTIKTGSLINKSAYLSVDGGESFRLFEGDVVTVSRSALETKLLRIHGRSFYEVLSKKLSDRE